MTEFLGAPYPIVKTPRGFFATQSGIDQIKSDLLMLLLTYPGERCMLPTFGTPLKDLIFEPNDAIVQDKAKQMIINSITLWEPRIVVSAIDVSVGLDQSALNPQDTGVEVPHILGIKIAFYDPENIKDVQDLTLEIPLGTT